MSKPTKPQKEIAKATAHLLDYSKKDNWNGLKQSYINDIMTIFEM